VTDGREAARSEAHTERGGRGRLLPFLRACERPNVGDVYSPWGGVTSVTEGKEAMRPEARAKSGRGCFLLF